MKEWTTSQLERTFVTKCLEQNQRFDGRSLDESRKIKIEFFSHPGSVAVSLGDTHVISRVSSEIIKPKETRANIGLLRIHLDASNIPYVTLDHWRHNDFAHQLNQILERNICQSDCIDLESLCIVAGEFVWSLKIYLTVQNNNGNILDCANIAALCSLCHYRLPEVSIRGTEIHIFSEAERYFRPLRILFHPVNVTFAFLAKGEIVLIDPCSDEERQMDGFIAVSSNQRQEICGIQMGGSLGLKREQIEICQKLAYRRAYEWANLIDQCLDDYLTKSKKFSLGIRSSDIKTTEETDEIEPTFDEDVSLNLISNLKNLSIGSNPM